MQITDAMNWMTAPLVKQQSPVNTGTVSKDGSSRAEGSSTPDRNDFLLLLTTQLQYQDPMKPVENEDFIAQLATFSSLDELIGIRKLLEAQAANGQVPIIGGNGRG